MSDSTQPVILLTGATSGIGKSAAQKLAKHDCRLVLHGRTQEKVRPVADELDREVETVAADLSSLDAVRKLAAEVNEKLDRLDILINNAGIGNQDEKSPDGFNLTMAVNYLAPFALTGLLIDKLRDSQAKIVNVASEAQSGFDFVDPGLTKFEDNRSNYGKSKLAMIMWTFELADRLTGTGTRALALHPGSMLDTPLVRRHYGHGQGSPDEGGEAIEYVALSPETRMATGQYFNQKQLGEPKQPAFDGRARTTLWHASERETGVNYPI